MSGRGPLSRSPLSSNKGMSVGPDRVREAVRGWGGGAGVVPEVGIEEKYLETDQQE